MVFSFKTELLIHGILTQNRQTKGEYPAIKISTRHRVFDIIRGLCFGVDCLLSLANGGGPEAQVVELVYRL